MCPRPSVPRPRCARPTSARRPSHERPRPPARREALTALGEVVVQGPEGRPVSMLLELRGVESSYGSSQVLFGMDLAIQPGQIVTLLGRNGMGKSTTMRAITGLNPAVRGEILLKGMPIHKLSPERIAQAGVVLVPEGRRIFPNLTVRENLIAFARAGNGASAWTEERVWQQFPSLARRRDNLGNQLSGGEQQMLAIGRALLRNGELLIIDEATEGLAPLIRQEIWRCLQLLKGE